MTEQDTRLSERVRARYPHVAPERSAFATEEEYLKELLVFWKGQAELTEGSFAALPHAVVTTLYDGTFAYANAQAQALFGLTPSDLSRHRANDYLYDADGHAIGIAIGKRIAAGEVIRAEAVYVKRPDGHRELRMLAVVPVFAAGTQTLVRAIGFFMDPSACERENESLRGLNKSLNESFAAATADVERYRAMAYTDEMTGLPNKRAFGEHGRPAIEEARRKDESIALFFADVDKLKPVNDNYGHQAGDEVIREVAGRLRAVAIPAGGFVARYAGDEFYILFQGLDDTRFQEISNDLARMLHFQVEAMNLTTKQLDSFDIVVAIGGVIRKGALIPDLGQLIQKADKVMYASKHKGTGEPYLSIPSLSSKPPKAT